MRIDRRVGWLAWGLAVAQVLVLVMFASDTPAGLLLTAWIGALAIGILLTLVTTLIVVRPAIEDELDDELADDGTTRSMRSAGAPRIAGLPTPEIRRPGSDSDRSRPRELPAGLLQAFPDAFLLLRNDSVVLDAHVPAPIRWLPPTSALIGQPIRGSLPAAAVDQLTGMLANPRRRVSMVLEQMWPIAPDQQRSIELRISPVDDTRWLAVLRDISGRKQFERDLLIDRNSAENRLIAQGQFLARVTHDLRTPIAGILGMIDLSLEDQLPTGVRDSLRSVRRTGEAMLTLTADLMDYAQIESKRMELEIVPFGLRDHLFSFLDEMVLQAERKGIELVVDMPPEIPEMLLGDPGRLRQVIVNLLSNAIKYTEEGEVLLTVAEAKRDARHVTLQISVRDTGIGIPADKLSQIFEAFERGDASIARMSGGTGLGLAIAKQLVELMDGEIWVESKATKGSTFHFTARLRQADRETNHLRPTHPERLRDRRVIIGSANRHNRQFLSGMISSWGMEVISVGSRAEVEVALDRSVAEMDSQPPLAPDDDSADETPPISLMLLDAGLLYYAGESSDTTYLPSKSKTGGRESSSDGPDESWLQGLIRHEALRDARTLLLTTHNDRLAPDEMERLNLAGFLTKPVKPALLLRAVLAALGLRGKQSGATLITRQSLRMHEPELTVLVADDEVVNRKLVSRLLERRQHVAHVAVDGAEALEMLFADSAPAYDVVLLDLEMPRVDGFEAARRIRRRLAADPGRAQSLKVIGMTAHIDPEIRERALETGLDYMLVKPINSESLFDALDATLGIGRGTDSLVESDSDVPNRQPSTSQLERLRREAESAAVDTKGDKGLTDLKLALARVEGDREMMRELIDVVQREIPGKLAKLHAAIEARDAKKVEYFAYAISVAIGPFAPEATDLALQAEQAGRAGAFEDAAATYRELRDNLRHLQASLSAIAQHGN